jgi:hypothetical protein
MQKTGQDNLHPSFLMSGVTKLRIMKLRSQMARMEEIRNENKFSVGGSEKKEVSWEGYG